MACEVCQDFPSLSCKRGSAVHVQGLFLLDCEPRMGEVGEGRGGKDCQQG